MLVLDGRIVGRGQNRVTSTNDPMAHAEISALRDACVSLGCIVLACNRAAPPVPVLLDSLRAARIRERTDLPPQLV